VDVSVDLRVDLSSRPRLHQRTPGRHYVARAAGRRSSPDFRPVHTRGLIRLGTVYRSCPPGHPIIHPQAQDHGNRLGLTSWTNRISEGLVAKTPASDRTPGRDFQDRAFRSASSEPVLPFDPPASIIHHSLSPVQVVVRLRDHTPDAREDRVPPTGALPPSWLRR